MFKCDNCGKNTTPKQPTNKVVLQTRPRIYENVIVKGRDKGLLQKTEGFEVVKEAKVCPTCYMTLTGLQPVVVQEEPRVVQAPPRPRKPRFDKSDPNWKFKRELDDIRRREAESYDPNENYERPKPVVEKVYRIPKRLD